jgi:hypothetical protein
MMTEDQFHDRVAELRRRGFSADEAERIAGALGDAILTDDQGKWIVTDETGQEIARIDPLD